MARTLSILAVCFLPLVSSLAAEDLFGGTEVGGGTKEKSAKGGTEGGVAESEIDIDAIRDDMLASGKTTVRERVKRLPGEPPFWPMGVPFPAQIRPPDPKGRGGEVDAYAWVPPGTNRIRVMLLIAPGPYGKQFGQHPAVRKVAEKHRVGIVYLTRFVVNRDIDKIGVVLAATAKYTEVPDFRSAPWIAFGAGDNARFCTDLSGGQPERTVATIVFRAPAPAWPVPQGMRLGKESILHVNVNGDLDEDAAWGCRDRARLLNYQQTSGWLPHIVLVRCTGQMNNLKIGYSLDADSVSAVLDYLAMFMDRALTLRVPADPGATDVPVPLKQVDSSSGFLVEPYAVEDIRRVVRWPMKRNGDLYEAPDRRDREPLADGYAAISPMKEAVPDGVPVVPLVVGQPTSKWLVTEGVQFEMKKDPWLGLGEWADLRPVPGTKIDVDGVAQTFQPLRADREWRDGGISLGAGFQTKQTFSLLGYTVLELKEDRALRLRAYTSAKGRLQVVINGQHVDDSEVLELKKGLYPTFFALRLQNFWENVRFWFDAAGEEDVRKAKASAAVQAAQRLALRAGVEAAARTPASFVYKYTDVKEGERRRMFWMADREQADAWLKLHDPKRQDGRPSTVEDARKKEAVQ